MHVVLAENATLQAMYIAFKAGVAPMANITGFSSNLVFRSRGSPEFPTLASRE